MEIANRVLAIFCVTAMAIHYRAAEAQIGPSAIIPWFTTPIRGTTTPALKTTTIFPFPNPTPLVGGGGAWEGIALTLTLTLVIGIGIAMATKFIRRRRRQALEEFQLLGQNIAFQMEDV